MADISIHEYFELYTRQGDRFHGDMRYTKELVEKPVIIICHGFMAFKDWGFFPAIARWFASSGFVTLIFNFSKNGVEGNNDRITDFEKFTSNTISQETEDLKTVVDAVWNGQLGSGIIDRSRIILLGHSRGGAIAILQASNDDRIKDVISWSAISTFSRWNKHQKEQWKSLGYLPLAENTTDSPLRIGIGLLEDVQKNQDKLDLLKAAGRIRIPWLIVHGEMDVTVSYQEAENLFAASNQNSTELMLLEKAGHIYNAGTENEDDYTLLKQIFNRTLNWLQQQNK